MKELRNAFRSTTDSVEENERTVGGTSNGRLAETHVNAMPAVIDEAMQGDCHVRNFEGPCPEGCVNLDHWNRKHITPWRSCFVYKSDL